MQAVPGAPKGTTGHRQWHAGSTWEFPKLGGRSIVPGFRVPIRILQGIYKGTIREFPKIGGLNIVP